MKIDNPFKIIALSYDTVIVLVHDKYNRNFKNWMVITNDKWSSNLKIDFEERMKANHNFPS